MERPLHWSMSPTLYPGKASNKVYLKTFEWLELLLKNKLLVRSGALGSFSPALSHSIRPFLFCSILISLSVLQWAGSLLPQGLCRWCFFLPATFSSPSSVIPVSHLCWVMPIYSNLSSHTASFLTHHLPSPTTTSDSPVFSFDVACSIAIMICNYILFIIIKSIFVSFFFFLLVS